MLRYCDDGEGVKHPYSPAPMFRTGNETYVLFTHNHDGMGPDGITPETKGNWRNPLFILCGHYVKGAHQPIWFDEPVELMNNGGVKIERMDLAMYASMTIEDDGPVFWYPDRKFFLLGRRIL